MEDVPRRIYVLAILTAAAAGAYVAYRLGLRARDRQVDGDGTAAFAPAVGAIGPEEPWIHVSPLASTERVADASDLPAEVPTEEIATVVATMEAPSPTASEKRSDGNGSGLPASATRATSTSSKSIPPPVVLPRARGLSGATLAGVATVVGVAALALGAWAVVESTRSDRADAGSSAVALDGVQQVVSLLSKPSTERIPLQGSKGRIILVVGARGYGVLVLDGLSPAPAGKSYQAWVIKPNAQAPESAAIFSGGDVVVPLTTPVPVGAAVAITLERAGGVTAPTRTPKLVATRAT